MELNKVYTPLGLGVVVEITIEEKTKGGIYIPETLQENKKIVKVVAKGKDVKKVSVGDHVMVNINRNESIPEIDLVSRNHMQISEHQILGVVSKSYKVPEGMKVPKAERLPSDLA